MQARAQLGCMAQRVEELLPTATPFERRTRRGHGLHEASIPGGRPAHLPGK
jgi:hypothetical protein